MRQNERKDSLEQNVYEWPAEGKKMGREEHHPKWEQSREKQRDCACVYVL